MGSGVWGKGVKDYRGTSLIRNGQYKKQGVLEVRGFYIEEREGSRSSCVASKVWNKGRACLINEKKMAGRFGQ